MRRYVLGFSLKLGKTIGFKPKWILMKTFVESYFRVIWVSEFHTKGNSSEAICWVSVWNYVTLSVSNKSDFLWTHLLSLILKLCKFMSFKQKRFLMKAFVECQVEVMSVYEFQTKENFYEGIPWVPVWSYLTLRVSKKTEFLWRHLLSLSFKLCKFMSFKPNQNLKKAYVESQLEVI